MLKKYFVRLFSPPSPIVSVNESYSSLPLPYSADAILLLLHRRRITSERSKSVRLISQNAGAKEGDKRQIFLDSHELWVFRAYAALARFPMPLRA